MPGNAPNNVRPVGTKPIWQLMSGSSVCPGAVISYLNSTAWVSEGNTPWMTLYEYTTGRVPPTNLGSLRVFLSGSYGDVVSSSGYTSVPLGWSDQALSYFTSSYEFTVNKAGTSYAVAPQDFPSSSYTSDQVAGPFTVGATLYGSLQCLMQDIHLYYGLTTANTTQRQGLYISAISGSPPLSFEPIAQTPIEIFEGDIWMYTGSVDSFNNYWASSLYIGERDISGSTHAARVATTRVGESSSLQLFNRLATGDRPTGSVLAVNSVVVDEWLYTYNSPSASGAGWVNLSWGGGLYMPDSGTVAVYGAGKDFLVPSGNLYINRDIYATGSVYLASGNVYLESGALRINTGSLQLYDTNAYVYLSGVSASLLISGTQASAYLRGSPVMNIITGSTLPTALSPQPRDATLYVKTNESRVFVRISGSWIEFSGDAPAVMDGGSY